MTSQNKEFKGRAQLALGLAIGPRSWTTEMCGRNPSPSQRTLHWLFKHNAHRDLDPAWEAAQDDAIRGRVANFPGRRMSDDEMIVYTSTPHAQARANELHNECLNAALPYSALLEDEGVRSLSLSLGGLRSAVAIGDLQRGTNFHCAALRRTISLKHELTDAMRAESIRLIYALVTADIDLQLSMRRTWCALLSKRARRVVAHQVLSVRPFKRGAPRGLLLRRRLAVVRARERREPHDVPHLAKGFGHVGRVERRALRLGVALHPSVDEAQSALEAA